MKKQSIRGILFLIICILAACIAGCQKTADKPSLDVAKGHYESELGWQVHYNPEYVTVEEKDTNDVIFRYLGEAVGDNYVEIQYFPDRKPREVLDEILEEADEDSYVRDQGYIVEDQWAYTAEVESSDEERDVTTSLQSAEYNGGVLLTKLVMGVTDENILEGYMGDILWQILDTLAFNQPEPQTEFANVPGTYTRVDAAAGSDTPKDAKEKAAEGSIVDTIILYDEHSGTFGPADGVPLVWGSKYLVEKNGAYYYEYALDGDKLTVKIDDQNIEYQRQPVKAETNPYQDPQMIKDMNKEIDMLYHDASYGRYGRIHKMQAFILELAMNAKARNPDFKIIPQNCVFLAYKDGIFENGDQSSMRKLIDGWGVEGVVGKGETLEPNSYQRMYIDQVKKGKFVSDTTAVRTEEEQKNYLARAKAWGISPFPKLGGELAEELMPGQRWADNGDYFWVEDPELLGISDWIDGSRSTEKLSDAKSFLYNINSRPYDNWQDWDKEEAEFEKGDGDRTRITDSYACGLLVPSEKGTYKPIGEEEEEEDETVEKAIEVYGDHWDWWWRKEGFDENTGRETWLKALRDSEYDVIYIDSFYNHRARPENQTPLTREEVESLKHKPDGSRRQVIAYLAIGTAEQNRWYCQDDWIWIDPANKNSFYSMKTGQLIERGMNVVYVPFKNTEAAKADKNMPEPPSWLAFGYGDAYPEESVVQWWHEDWRNIIINGGGKYTHKVTGDNTSSIDRIIQQGFDGVYLDNADTCVDPSWDSFEEYWFDKGGIPEK